MAEEEPKAPKESKEISDDQGENEAGAIKYSPGNMPKKPREPKPKDSEVRR